MDKKSIHIILEQESQLPAQAPVTVPAPAVQAVQPQGNVIDLLIKAYSVARGVFPEHAIAIGDYLDRMKAKDWQPNAEQLKQSLDYLGSVLQRITQNRDVLNGAVQALQSQAGQVAAPGGVTVQKRTPAASPETTQV